MMKNKRGSSLAGWLEVSGGLVIIMTLILIIFSEMNSIYDKNLDGSFGISTNSTRQKLIDYQDTLKQNVKEGEASSSGLGISLTTIWAIISAGVSMMWEIVTGGWISSAIITYFHAGEAGVILALVLRVMFVLSIGLIVIKLVLKVKA